MVCGCALFKYLGELREVRVTVVGNLHHAGSDELVERRLGTGDIVIVRELLNLSTELIECLVTFNGHISTSCVLCKTIMPPVATTCQDTTDNKTAPVLRQVL